MKEKKERFKIFKKLHEYWQIPRYRSLITLGLYLLFFATIILYANIMNGISDNKEEKYIDPLTIFKNMNNYEYNYEINISSDELSSYTISGIRYQEQDNFQIMNSNFYIRDNIIYSLDSTKDITDMIKIDLLLIRPNYIYEFLNRSTSKNKIEYQSGEEKVIYKVPVKNFNVAFLQSIDESNIEEVEITTYEKNNQIYQIDLNIYNLMKLVDSNINSYTIKINYSNINNIKSVEN